MTEQLQLRRGTATQIAAFTGAQGEVVVDTTNNRAVVNDGSTPGGWPAAKLSEVVTNTRTAVSDVAYSALATDRLVAYTALTAARVVTLPAASAYPTGTRLMIVDESGACSSSKTITVSRAGSDTINGATSFVINAAYAGLELESNGSNAWIVLNPAPNMMASLVGVGTAPDPNNPLSVYGSSALFNSAGSFNVTVNKGGSAGASSDTASFIFEDGFSGRAQMGLNGSDNFSIKVSPNGSSWTTAIALDATTGAATFGNMRTAVSDAAYSALVTDRLIAYAALTAARVVTLPAASAYPAGQALTIADESGSCSATDTITISRAGSDTINGASSAVLSSAHAYVALESNGANAWTIVDTSALFTGDSGSGGAAGLVPAPPSASAAYNEVLGAGGSWVGRMTGFRSRLRNAGFAINQRAVSGTVSLSAGQYGHDGVKAGASGATYTFSTSGIDTTLTISAGSLILPIEAGLIEGGAYVVSQAGTAQARVWQGTGYAGSGSYATAPFTMTGLSAATQTNVEFSTGTVLRPQFEPGAIATAFDRRPAAVELLLCYRYYQQLGLISGYTLYAIGNATSTTNFFFLMPLRAQMRAGPTVTLSALSTFFINGYVGTPSAIAGTAWGPALISLTVTTSGATLGAACLIQDGGSNTSSIQCSAEI